MLKIRKAYKVQLKTNENIEHKLISFCGSSRFLWNKCLAMNLDRLEKRQPILWYNELAYWLTLWKRSEEYGFLKECPSQVLQQRLRDLERAFMDCFDKSQSLKRTPVFKKKSLNDGIRFPQGFRIDNRRIFLPKIGWVGFHKSCEITGTVKNITITKRGRQWFASIQVEQRILSRKKRGSENWKRQKREIAKLHHTIANVRSDFLHKLSTNISENQAKVYVEELKIRNMSASANGSIEEPGRNVKAKSGLNKSILDQGWYEFRRQLDYKLFWRGGMLVEVNPPYTSQRCSCCGYTAEENRVSQDVFRCQVCGHEENADVNAAINILTVGQTGMACQANRISGRQQEPAGIREEVLPVAS